MHSVDPWDSAVVLAPLLIGVALIVAFGVFEWRAKTDGMLDHRLFWYDWPYLL